MFFGRPKNTFKQSLRDGPSREVCSLRGCLVRALNSLIGPSLLSLLALFSTIKQGEVSGRHPSIVARTLLAELKQRKFITSEGETLSGFNQALELA